MFFIPPVCHFFRRPSFPSAKSIAKEVWDEYEKREKKYLKERKEARELEMKREDEMRRCCPDDEEEFRRGMETF